MVYSNEPIGELVSRDTDADGILDWEEGLWGTDPTKTDTNGDGTTDDVEIAKLKSESVGTAGTTSSGASQSTKLTETEKFANQLFTTITALGQSGSLDSDTVDRISTSLASNIENYTPKKIYDINVLKTTDNSEVSLQAYKNKLLLLQKKYPLDTDIAAIVLESLTQDGEIDVKVYEKFNPVISQINSVINEMLGMSIPKEILALHLAVINNFEIVVENLNDMKLVESDTILAFTAMNQYGNSLAQLQDSINKLMLYINQN